jgi:type VII secretion integral membrane protein EccD
MSAPGLVRLTVASSTRRVDLVLPGAVPVAELVPELARSVGLLDPGTVHGDYRLITIGGRVLAGGAGLAAQGIEDGGLLTLTAGVDDVPPRVYDDVVEAMADVVERDLKPWEPASGRRTALAAAGLMMALGAGALSVQASAFASAAATTVAVILALGAIVVSRVQRQAEAAVAMGWIGASYAAVAGFTLAPDGPVFGLPVASAGAGATAVGLACLVGLAEGRTLMIPPLVVGAIFLATGLVTHLAPVDPVLVHTTALTLVVMVGSILPWLALGMTGATVHQLRSIQDVDPDPDPIDLDRVSAEARVAHQILVAVSAAVGLLLVSIAPLAVSLGLSGTLLAAGSCLVVMLRTRQHRARPQVLVGLVCGILGLLSVAISLVWLYPGWRPMTAMALAVSGGLQLAVTLLPSTSSARWGRVGDLAEGATLLALVPLLVVATGVFAAIRG